MSITAKFSTTLWLSLCVTLGACSSSDGDGSNNGDNDGPKAQEGAPDVSVSSSYRQLNLSWNKQEKDQYYLVSENPDGASGFTEIARVEGETQFNKDIAVHRHNWADAGYIVEACDASECIPSLEISTHDVAAGAIGYLKASNTGVDDEFGQSISISDDGRTLVVGAHDEESASAENPDDNSVHSAGAVYVYILTDAGWELDAYLKSSDIARDDDFGHSVALSGDGSTLAVGAPWEENRAEDEFGDSGAVYIFTRDENGWVEQSYLRASTVRDNGHFGFSLSLSDDGNLLAVGAPGGSRHSSGSESELGDESVPEDAEVAGEAYLFARNDGAWTELAALVPSNLEVEDRFGYYVALSGDGSTLAVGATREGSGATGVNGDPNDNSAPGAGAAYVFGQQDQGWVQQAYLKANNTATASYFGYSLAISDNGNWLAVGAREENDRAGGVHVFNRSGQNWSHQGHLTASNADTNDLLGTSIAMNDEGTTIAVGASGEDSDAVGVAGDQNSNAYWTSGAVYVFDRSQDSWAQTAYVKAPNTQIESEFGHSVALDETGDTLAVGAVMEDGGSSGFGGDQAAQTAENSGAVYLY